MIHVIEKREYGPHSSEAEIKAIKNRVYLHRPGVIYWKEVPVMSCWQVEQFGEKIAELIAGLDSFSLLIDLTESKPPDARIRESLRKTLTPLKQKGIKKSAAFTGKNFLINVAAKFVLGGSGLNFTVHTKQQEAEAAIEDNHK